jgi:hypothetical protein
MRKTSKIAATAAGLVLAGGAAAAAVTVPDAADPGLTKAEEHTGTELPASKDNHPGGGAPESVTVDADTPDAADHGTEVSDTAQSTESGPGKGATVAEVASEGRAGGEALTGAPVATPNDGGIDTGSEASDGANATGAENAADQAGEGSGNAGDHGAP